jgi:chromosome segregation ATPase
VKALQADLAAAERREKHAERVADDAERRCEALKEELKEAKNKTQARDAEARELGRAVAVLKAGADEAKAESTDAARKLTSVTSTAARLASEAKEFHARRATLERENGALAAAVQDLKRENVGLKSKLGRAEDDVERLRERLEKAEEDAKTSARDLERVSLDAEAARREARASKARDELGARESSGLASSLRDAKAEVAEMRRRCEYLERIAAFAAAAGSETTPGGVYVEGRPVPGRDVPANRPFSSAFRGGAPPAPDPKAHRRDGAAPAPRPF